MPNQSYLLDDTPLIDLDTERGLLGLVLSQRRIPPALSVLRPEHFGDLGHRGLWSMLSVLHGAARPERADRPERTEDDDRLLNELQAAAPGDAIYIQNLSDAGPDLDPGLIDLYVNRLLELYDKRHLWSTAIQALRQVRDNAHTGVTAAELRLRQIADLHALDLSTPANHVATWADLHALAGPTGALAVWDWPGWLPQGCLVLLAAASGMGKSLLALRLAASYLRGDPWPDGSRPDPSLRFAHGPPSAGLAAVLWCESEAAQFLNLKRASAWGLPCEQIWTPLKATRDVQLDRPDHRAAISRLAVRPQVRLVIVDSLSGASQAAENTGHAMDVVQWLAELARDTHKPILLLHHLRKRAPRTGADSGPHTVRLEDLRGHGSIVQPARIVLALDAPDPVRPQIKRLSVVKNSLAALPPPLGFYVAPGSAAAPSAADDGAPAWSGPQLIFCPPPQPPHGLTLFACAVERLRDLLAQGPLPVALVHRELAQSGISKRTTHRAKAYLGIRTSHQDGRWIWLLPAVDAGHSLLDEPSS